MKIEPRRGPPSEQPAPEENITPGLEAGALRTGHRRTIVTVERETLSFLVRRPIEDAAPVPTRPGEDQPAPEPPDKSLLEATSPAKELGQGKP